MKCLLLLSVLGLAAAFPNKEGLRIIGGDTCKANSIPYIVSLNYGYDYCGGALINDQWVVSAGHCNQSLIVVRLGEHNLRVYEGTEQFILSAKIIQHPEYNSRTLDNDIMLIKLHQPAVINKWVQTISLPSQCDVAGTQCVVSGWGSTDKNADNYPDLLQCLDLPILSDRECKELYGGEITGSGNVICAGFLEGGKGACPGDSGGPLACNGELQGIVSAGDGCGMPTIYTKVCNYVSWITDTIANN